MEEIISSSVFIVILWISGVWECSESGVVDGDTDIGTICVTKEYDGDSPSFPILEWLLEIFPNVFFQYSNIS